MPVLRTGMAKVLPTHAVREGRHNLLIQIHVGVIEVGVVIGRCMLWLCRSLELPGSRLHRAGATDWVLRRPRALESWSSELLLVILRRRG